MIVFAAKVSVKKVVAGVLAVGVVAAGVALLAPGAAETDPSAGIRTQDVIDALPPAYRAAFEAAPPEQQAALLAEVGLSQV